ARSEPRQSWQRFASSSCHPNTAQSCTRKAVDCVDEACKRSPSYFAKGTAIPPHSIAGHFLTGIDPIPSTAAYARCMRGLYVVGALLLGTCVFCTAGLAESDRDANGVYFSGAAVLAAGVLIFVSGFRRSRTRARKLETQPVAPVPPS